MKKKNNAVALLVIAIVIGAGFFCGLSKHTNAYLEMNVEALSDPELEEMDGSSEMCSQTGNEGAYTMKRCGYCSGSLGKYAMDRVAYCNI